MRNPLLALAIACLAPLPAAAQFVDSIRIEPSEIKAGESATITVGISVQSGINCGLRLHFGDGSSQDFKINQEKDVPMVVTRAYAKPGSYELKAEPKTVGMVVKCGGRNQSGLLKVTGAAAPAAARGAAAGAAPACPEGWTLDRKSVRRKTGAFTCTARAGTPAPEPRLACPGDLAYFENLRKGRMGCQP